MINNKVTPSDVYYLKEKRHGIASSKDLFIYLDEVMLLMEQVVMQLEETTREHNNVEAMHNASIADINLLMSDLHDREEQGAMPPTYSSAGAPSVGSVDSISDHVHAHEEYLVNNDTTTVVDVLGEIGDTIGED